MKKWSWLFLFLLTGVLLVGCGAEENAKDLSAGGKAEETATEAAKNSTEPGPALQLLENEKVGEYLADAKGMTLYYFAKDTPNTTNCSDDCLKNWPAFYGENVEVPEGYNKEDFGTITRGDTGEKQTTYKGFPLYYFVNDKATGDVNGQGVKEVWFIVNSETTFSQ
ncbi:hypothetical protein [Fictibacillus barbaricus]|uniref:Lipoprotein n=1 Tax=Fictibacillus barbaricus TaxID=182136 RepID=A0ABS2ZB61_9BACL|nr:hypothetical protein [Fictibacillus barbaricus]MBN3544981.1 hypothetical protein [Fictibacillus barbaricus]GGB62620.1 hypothetical protein GCM10007199_30720 [Fictibacillus barbaricus]